MLEWLTEYQRTGDIKSGLNEPEPPEELEGQNADTTAVESVANAEEFETFHHRSPAAESDIPELPIDENVKTAIQAIIEALSGLVGQSPFDCDQNIEIVDNQIVQLAMVHQMLIDIRNRAENSQIKEAA
jgi:hypothetical protein